MKIILAPDSFKGTISAMRAAQLLEEAAKRVFGPEVVCVRVPIADGGEGTLDAILFAQPGERRVERVTGPRGDQVEASWALLSDGHTAVIEMAQAAGLPLMGENRDPMTATSRGVGELMLRALDAGAKRILIGLGGSATNDGGAGLLRALGARFPDAEGQEAPEGGAGLRFIEKMELSRLDKRLSDVEMTVLSDVTNPLLGERGATHVYGPQKGATVETLPLLEAGMARYAAACEQALGRDIASFPGAGAAGGLGAALSGVLGGRLQPGIDAVLELAGFDELLSSADLCVTGEGRIDGQSVRFGKAISGIARRCAQANVPLSVIAGGMSEDAEALYEMCRSSIMVTVNGPMALPEALAKAEELFSSAAERMFRLIEMGRRMRD